MRAPTLPQAGARPCRAWPRPPPSGRRRAEPASFPRVALPKGPSHALRPPRTYYEAYGEGEALILLHGGPLPRLAWAHTPEMQGAAAWVLSGSQPASREIALPTARSHPA